MMGIRRISSLAIFNSGRQGCQWVSAESFILTIDSPTDFGIYILYFDTIVLSVT